MGGRAEAAERRGQAAVLGEAPSGCPTLCPSPASPTAGEGSGHSCFHPAREREGKSIPAVSGEPSGSGPRAGARSRAPTAERTPNFALSSPQPPLCHNFAAATVRGNRPTPPLGSPPSDPVHPEVREGHPKLGPEVPNAAPTPKLAPSRWPSNPPRCSSSAHLH